MVISYADDMILVDAGLAFPSEDMLGVDLVLPDISFLIENQDKLKGLIVTHGHEDHIGGIPYILKEISIPVIYGPALALGLLEGKFTEYGVSDRTTLRSVRPRQRVRAGCFEIEFVRCTHSIADSYSVIIRTPVGTIIHTGDFKFDFTPVDGELFDIASLANAAEEGVLLLMSDSTNTERPGFTPSERTVWHKLNEVFANAKQRIIVTTFASNVHRVRQVLQAALKYDRRVAILGRSMLNFANIARELGYMSFPDGLLIPVELVNELPVDQVVILTTGSQGEPMSALTRIANDEHRQIRIVPGDTVVISATPIPGNERLVANTINALFLRGADVVYGRDSGVHVSGHACREEQKLMINICKPKFFMPIHGEYRMLVRHAALAVECGVHPDNVFVMENGEVLEITKDRCRKAERIKSGLVLIDQNREWQLDEEIIEQRRHLAEDGLITVVVLLDDKHKVIAGPDVFIRAVVLPRGVPAEEFVIRVQEQVRSILSNNKAIQGLNERDLSDYLHGALSRFFATEIKAQPLVQIQVNMLVNGVAMPPKTEPAKSQTDAKSQLESAKPQLESAKSQTETKVGEDEQ